MGPEKKMTACVPNQKEFSTFDSKTQVECMKPGFNYKAVGPEERVVLIGDGGRFDAKMGPIQKPPVPQSQFKWRSVAPKGHGQTDEEGKGDQ